MRLSVNSLRAFLLALALAAPVYAQDVEMQDVIPAEEPIAELPAPEASAPAPEAPKKEEAPPVFTAVALKVLNKVTARTLTVEAGFGRVTRAGNVEIVAHRCERREMQGLQDDAALLEIWSLKPGEGPAKSFEGWMFSSRPGASGMEDSVYDVWVDHCSANTLKE